MTIIEIIVTILLGTAAGFINTFAGGGSMLVVPFLIFIGLPANVANATNRIAILLQNVVSVNGFKQKKILDFKTDSKLLLPVALGSIAGAFIAVDINEEIFKKVIAGLLITCNPLGSRAAVRRNSACSSPRLSDSMSSCGEPTRMKSSTCG